jgi:hypothetical protein
MFKMVTKILGVIALTGWMGAANAALIFDFSWDSSDGKIIGEIYGLSDNGEYLEASGIVLTSVNGSKVMIDIFDDMNWYVDRSFFDVADGEIIGYEVRAERIRVEGKFKMRSSRGQTAGYYTTSYSSIDNNQNYYDQDVDVTFFTSRISFVNRVTVPEPSSVILMLLGLAGLSFARYRKQY